MAVALAQGAERTTMAATTVPLLLEEARRQVGVKRGNGSVAACSCAGYAFLMVMLKKDLTV
jgi:hypothetical protein